MTLDLFGALPVDAPVAPPPLAAAVPVSTPWPHGYLEHVGCQVIWHLDPAAYGSRTRADLSIRVRLAIISDFYRKLKIRNIAALPDRESRRRALNLFRQLAGDAEGARVEAGVREQFAQAAP